MTTYSISDYSAYPVRYGTDARTGTQTAFFRDFNASTCDDDEAELREAARDWLTLCGLTYPRSHRIIPAASLPRKGEEVVKIPPTLALKFILRNVMTERNLRPTDLARLLDMSPQAVNGLLDVYREGTRFDALYRALEACGAEVSVTGPSETACPADGRDPEGGSIR